MLNEHMETHNNQHNPVLMLRALTEITTVVSKLANDIVAIKSDSIIVNTDVYSTIKDEVIEQICEKVDNKFEIVDKRVDHIFQQLGNLEKCDEEVKEKKEAPKKYEDKTSTPNVF